MNRFAELQARSLIESATSGCEDYLQEETPKFYLGVDPTGKSLHLGNFQGFILAKWLEKMGCEVTILIGGVTASVGDPSGKMSERSSLGQDQIEDNSSSIQSWIARFMGPSIRIVNNRDWFDKMNLTTYLRDIGHFFRMGPMLGKEWIRRRIQSDVGMSYTEFSYQLLQAYDFLYLFEELGIRLQIGGSDQWGNVTAGCELIRKKTKESTHGFVWPLLTKEDGTKFGKSESGAIWLDSDLLAPADFYQEIVALPDSIVINALRSLTFLPLSEIEHLEKSLSKRDLQHLLAKELTLLIHGDKGLEEAHAGKKLHMEKDISQVSEDELEKAKTATISRSLIVGKSWLSLCVELGWLESKNVGRRLLVQGAVKINGKQVDVDSPLEDSNFLKEKFIIFNFGKKNQFILKAS
ncbi:tyrosine--tRNA ligase [Candidatus Similichlamydia epinepheli]|uniref:tyrosine--tRNA ligase n=1 Tax=Candidatus Similichlamydia epinepheli TaxID=1903953 RepID=UPI000D340056|nr:tyrosine--tRNA ligase [Candidatus Similichlamydia epinepheli]